MTFFKFSAVVSALTAFVLATSNVSLGGQVVLGQVDDFQNGTAQGWSNGVDPDPVNVPSGGPAGATDAFLQVSSGTLGGGPRLITFNDAQWIGNYASAHVNEISMDLKDLGSQTLSMRIAMRATNGNSGTPGYASTTAFSLPADNAWHHAVFFIDTAHLTGINSPAALSTFLTSVGDFRLLSSANPALVGDSLSGRFGVDNITAIPEPSGIALAVAGFVVAALWRWQRKGVGERHSPNDAIGCA
jgi:hypothetical protein